MQRVDQYCPPEPSPLNFGIAIFCPISSVAGSATVILTQPLLTSNFVSASVIILAIQIFLLIAKRIFDLERVPVSDSARSTTIQMPLSDLNEILQSTLQDSSVTAEQTDGLNLTPRQRGFLTVETPEAPLLVGLYVYGTFFKSRGYSLYRYCPTNQN
ncbi:MAG: hypothetical protein M0T74_08300 [Desulfitobacterium hafniense]|nr:hypothetical protein [Desulfitobacterium hafniense]